jgi:hypothetical protein
MTDSVERSRFGERGLASRSPPSSFLSVCCSLVAAGNVIDCGDGGTFAEPNDESPGDGMEPCDEPKSKRPRANPRLFSDWRLNCSYSGFWSTGMMRGDAAAAARTLEEGGLQVPRVCCAALDAKTSFSAFASTARPK